MPSPNLTNTPRLNELLQNGKLMLSMSDAIALALENNLDIAISRYNLHIADTDVLRTKAGATLLGVNTGVVQGTPGGGVGGFGGATSATGGGAGGTTGGGGRCRQRHAGHCEFHPGHRIAGRFPTIPL